MTFRWFRGRFGGEVFGGAEGCEGCGQEPPPLIGAALLPSAGTVSGNGSQFTVLYGAGRLLFA